MKGILGGAVERLNMEVGIYSNPMPVEFKAIWAFWRCSRHWMR